MKIVDRIYNRYDHLAINYANKIWNNTDLAIEKEDLVQELRIRLFNSILTYLSKWREYRKNNGIKPIPMEYYLKTTMINKSRDIIKELSSTTLKISIEDSGFQIGNDALEITGDNSYDLICGFQNILDLFKGKTKIVMKLYFIHNFDLSKVLEHFSSESKKVKAEKEIEKGMERIKEYLKEDITNIQEFSYYEIQE